MPGNSTDATKFLVFGLWKTSSFVLSLFIINLFLQAKLCTFQINVNITILGGSSDLHHHRRCAAKILEGKEPEFESQQHRGPGVSPSENLKKKRLCDLVHYFASVAHKNHYFRELQSNVFVSALI